MGACRWPAVICAASLLSGCAPPVAAPLPAGSAGLAAPTVEAPVRVASKKKVASRRRAGEVRVPYSASGGYAVVPGRAAPRKGRGSVVRYLVEVERGLPFDKGDFAAAVHRTLNDPRGWARFQRVDRPPVRLRVALSSPATTDRQCLPLRTGGDLSCWNGTRSVINAVRWAKGVAQYRGDLAAYRDYVINHEVGHGLGHHHGYCPGRGQPAPVMAQQSKTLGGCRPNPWPFPLAGSRSTKGAPG